jgi:hypothetical protein
MNLIILSPLDHRDNAFRLEEVVEELPAFLSPACVRLAFARVFGLENIRVRITVFRIRLLKRPSSADWILDIESAKQSVEHNGGISVVLRDKRNGNSLWILKDDVVVGHLRRVDLDCRSEIFRLSLKLLFFADESVVLLFQDAGQFLKLSVAFFKRLT